jgi:hypothetical protein
MLLESLNEAIGSLPSDAFVISSEPQLEPSQQQKQQLLQPPTAPPNLPTNPEEKTALRAEERRDLMLAETTPRTSDLAGLLVSDKLDESIAELSELISKTDAVIGGNPQDDLIINPGAQQEIIGLIDNFIQSLEKQK